MFSPVSLATCVDFDTVNDTILATTKIQGLIWRVQP